jgi:hypothetical protein
LTSSQEYVEQVMLVDLETGSVLKRRLPLGIEGEILWLDTESFALSPAGFEPLDDRVMILDTSLRKIARFRGWYPFDSIIRDGDLWGLGYGSLRRADLPEGDITDVRDFLSAELVALEAVPDAIFPSSSPSQ